MAHKEVKNVDNKAGVKEENIEVISWQATKNDEVISWQAPEYEYNPKDVSWHWASIIIAIILVAIAFWQKNFLFAVFVVIAEVILLYFSNAFPKIWNFKIDDKGIFIGESLHLFSDMQSFDIHEAGEGYKEIIFKMKSKFRTALRVFIHIDDEKKIKQRISRFLPREEFPTSLADSFEKFIRF